jgi:hypothetical protein
MDVLDLEAWQNFAVATAGAAAALAGLIMVAISVNIKEIISMPGLPARAGASISAVVVVVVSALVMLVPGQPALFLGLELIVFGLIGSTLQASAARAVLSRADGPPMPARVVNAVLLISQTLWIIVGGAILATGSPAGLGLVVVGFVVTVITSMLNAWVLMVEILR